MLNRHKELRCSWMGWLLVFMTINLPIAQFVSGRGTDLVHPMIYADLFILILAVLMSEAVRVRYILAFFVILANEVVGSYWAVRFLGHYSVSYVYAILGFAMMLVITLGIDWSSLITKSDVDNVFLMIFIFGVVASLYAMTVQGHVIATNLAGGADGYNFTSFLGHRNQFGGILVLSMIAALYLWQDNRKIIYPVAVSVFFFNIVMTDSRNGIFSALLLLGLLFTFRHNIPIKALIIIAVPVLVLVAVAGLRFSDIEGAFAHKGGHFERGNLKEESRFLMWAALLAKMYEDEAFLSGFGTRATHYFLPQTGIEKVTSSHNAFVDLLFTGGIIKLGVYIIALSVMWRRICANPNPRYRDLMKASLLTLVFYNCFDNASILFTANSITSVLYTIILGILTWHKER